MSETIEMATSITELVSKVNDLEDALEKQRQSLEKVTEKNKLLQQSVTTLIFFTLEKMKKKN